jgi:hypothetical protein
MEWFFHFNQKTQEGIVMNINKYNKLLGILYLVSLLFFANNALSMPSDVDMCEGEEGVSYSLCKSYYKSLERYKMKTNGLAPPGEPCEPICPCNFKEEIAPSDTACWFATDENPVKFLSDCDFSEINQFWHRQAFVIGFDPETGNGFSTLARTFCIKNDGGDCVDWACEIDHNGDPNISCQYDNKQVQNLTPDEFIACNCELEKYAKEIYYSGIPIIAPNLPYEIDLGGPPIVCQ